MAVLTAEAEVLIVEDEMVYAFDVQSMLEDRDISASISHTGEDALRRMAEDPAVSLVLMDIDLGKGLDGIETARRILKEYDVPLLFLSAHTDSERTEPVSTIDHYGFVPKSAGEFAIIQAVTAALRLDRRRRGIVMSERRYHDLVESLSDAVIVIDTEYTVQTANYSAGSLLGSVRDASGQKCYRCFHGLDAPCPWCPVGDVLASGSSSRAVVPYPSPEGGSRWFHLDASPVIRSDGSVAAVVLSGRDVSEEEEARRRERDSQQVFKDLFRLAPQPYQSLDPAGRFIDVNDEWCKVLGSSREETVGRHFSEFLAPESVDLFNRRFPVFLEAGRVEGVEFTLVKDDGTTVQARFTGSIAYGDDRKPLRTHCIFEDITERRAMEKQIQERERLLRTFVDQSLEAIAITDSSGRITSWNPAAERQFGVSRQEVWGTPIWDVVFAGALPADGDALHIPVLREDIELLLSTGNSPLAGSILEMNYGHRAVHQRFFAFRGGDGFQVGLVSRDVTDLVAAEHALADRHRRVSNLLEERELLLKEVHHRIKNDMFLVRSLLSLQADRAATPEAAAELSEAAGRVTLMGRIYERLYQSDNYESIQIRPTLLSIVSDLLSGGGYGQIDLETEIEERELPRKISVPIGIIANELVNNSLKYAFYGNSKPHLRVALRVDKGMVEIEVEDNGPGIPPALRLPDGSIDPGAFDSFGYTMIRALVTQHFGSLSVEDARAGGTLVRARLTIPESEQAAS